MVADVAEPISVRVGLARVRVVRTIVRGIWNAVAVTVGVTGVADPIAVDVALRRVGDSRAVVRAGAETARRARVADAVEIRVDLGLRAAVAVDGSTRSSTGAGVEDIRNAVLVRVCGRGIGRYRLDVPSVVNSANGEVVRASGDGQRKLLTRATGLRGRLAGGLRSLREVARRDGCIRVANVVGLVLPAGRILAGSGPVQREVDVPAASSRGASRRVGRDHSRR